MSAQRNRALAGGLLLACLGVPMAAADSDAEARIADEIEATLLRLSEQGALKANRGNTLSLEREAKVRYELGAVVDIDLQASTVTIVAITPGGSAERMALQVGDRILAVNGLDLARSSDLGTDFAMHAARAKGELQLTVRRGTREFEVSGQADQVLVPGFRLRVELPRLPETGS